MRCRRWLTGGVFALAAGCGGGGGDGGGGSGGSCSPAPAILSSPPTVGSVDQQYVYEVSARMFCIPFFTACGIDFLQGPPQSGFDSIRGLVYWNVSPSDVNATVPFTIATKSDLCGNRAVQSWSVHVAPPPPDTVGPIVSQTDPGSGSVGVPFSYQIAAAFNEDLAPASVNAATFVVKVTSTGATVNGSFTYGNRWAVFIPSSPLAGSTNYTATIGPGVTDVSGNAMAAAYSWSFTTNPAPDTTPPLVSAVSPASGMTCTPVDGMITADFNENVKASGLQLRDSGGTVLVGTNFWDTLFQTTRIAFGPEAVLAYGAQYTVTVPATLVKDLAGNQMAADYIWTFTTVPANTGVGTWSAISMAGAPTGMSDHRAFWTGSEMIVWGEDHFGNMVGGRYNPTSNTWASMTNTGAPLKREDYAAVWTGSELLVWGGTFPNSQYRTDGGRYDPATDTWKTMSTIGAPKGARFAAAVWTGTEMIVFGGLNDLSVNTHNGRYNPSTNTWAPVSSIGAPNIESFNTRAIWTGSRMIVWGRMGPLYCYTCPLGGAAYNPVANTWSPISTLGAPDSGDGHSAVWTGSKMILWGGNVGAYGVTNTGRIYDPLTNTWQPMSTACGVPSERSGHLAVWTGSEMIVWSGSNSRQTFSGARYNPVADSWQTLALTGAPVINDYHSLVWTGAAALVWLRGYWGTPAGFRYSP